MPQTQTTNLSWTGRRQSVQFSSLMKREPLEPQWKIQHVCRAITTRYRATKGFVESDFLKSLRRAARGKPVAEARRIWKEAWKQHQQERKNIEDDRRRRALAKDWAPGHHRPEHGKAICWGKMTGEKRHKLTFRASSTDRTVKRRAGCLRSLQDA